MKLLFKLLLIALIFFIGWSCLSTKVNETSYPSCYQEAILSFYNPQSDIYDSSYTYSTWIRKPENILIAHESIKKFGYNKFIGLFGLSYGYKQTPIAEIVDSLIITYPDYRLSPTYFKEFWQRRISENNDSVVFEVLKELKIIMKKQPFEFNANTVNDTLVNLLTILEYNSVSDSITKEIAQSNFNYLVNIGMHQSAYNVLFEDYAYYDIDWDTELLKQSLKRDTNCLCISPWIIDNTK
jgi:hypothetical protein